MKNLDKYLIYFLLAAVAGLYILHFTQNSHNEDADEAGMLGDTLKSGETAEKTGRIYYINTDSVWAQYTYVTEISEMLSAKKAQYEGSLEKELRTFEREVGEFREKGPTMSEMEVQLKQRELVRKESELSQMGEELEMKFRTEEKEWNDKLRKKIINFIDKETKSRSYDYILGYSLTSNIILANDSLDLTKDIIEHMNQEYALEKTQK